MLASLAPAAPAAVAAAAVAAVAVVAGVMDAPEAERQADAAAWAHPTREAARMPAQALAVAALPRAPALAALMAGALFAAARARAAVASSMMSAVEAKATWRGVALGWAGTAGWLPAMMRRNACAEIRAAGRELHRAPQWKSSRLAFTLTKTSTPTFEAKGR